MAGLDLDPPDPVAHPDRDLLAGRLGLPDKRLGQEADVRQRGPQLVRQVVDELAPDPLEPAQLRYVLEDQPQAGAVGRRASADHEGRTVRGSQGQLGGRRAGDKGALGQLLDPPIDERLDQAPPDQTARPAAGKQVGRRVGGTDHERPVEPDDPDTQRVGQGPQILARLGHRPARVQVTPRGSHMGPGAGTH